MITADDLKWSQSKGEPPNEETDDVDGRRRPHFRCRYHVCECRTPEGHCQNEEHQARQEEHQKVTRLPQAKFAGSRVVPCSPTRQSSPSFLPPLNPILIFSVVPFFYPHDSSLELYMYSPFELFCKWLVFKLLRALAGFWPGNDPGSPCASPDVYGHG